LVKVKVIVDVPPDDIVTGLKFFTIVGFAKTVKSTDADGDPMVVSAVVTPLATFGLVPT
jgi:hypothetical protein